MGQLSPVSTEQYSVPSQFLGSWWVEETAWCEELTVWGCPHFLQELEWYI